MSVRKWKLSGRGTNPLTLMSTELNSLSGTLGTGVLSSSAVSNSSDLDLYMEAELHVTFASAPADGNTVDLYIVRSVDGGTTFEDTQGTDPAAPRFGYVGSFSCRAVTSAQVITIPKIELPPADFKLFLVNNTTKAFPASGSLVRGLFYGEQIV